MLSLDKNIPSHIKVPYTPEEIKILWDNVTVPDVDKILMLIYTGVRISEFLRLKIDEDIFIDKRYFIVRKSKTIAGYNRPVPVHSKIHDFFCKYMKNNSNYLMTTNDGRQMSYTAFRSRYNRALKSIGLKHTIHECRHTCATLLDNAGANDMCIRKILGHSGNVVTEQVYIHKNITDLISAMDLIK